MTAAAEMPPASEDDVHEMYRLMHSAYLLATSEESRLFYGALVLSMRIKHTIPLKTAASLRLKTKRTHARIDELLKEFDFPLCIFC